ncbi:hypothetical protein [Pseudodesulfovibrio sp.]|uniref:hypothetical protein n=1 Tax=unclassified Pseudodesulfovibrio TaxID=2661612 RepID=UPI003AFF8486
MTFTKADIQRVLNNEPELVDRGIGVYVEKGGNRDEAYNRGRELLLSEVDSFNAACNWLDKQPRTKNINANAPTSYTLKHCAERWDKANNGGSGYISNGTLIAAAIHLGFKYKKYPDSPNVHLNISKKLVANEHGCF